MISCIAIDVGWLISVSEMDFDELSHAVAALDRLSERDIPLLLDHDGAILTEYDRYLPYDSIGRKLVASRQMRGLVTYRSGRLTNACAETLHAVGFDMDDSPYIGAAQSCSAGFFLTTESKHRTDPWLSALRDRCGVLPGSLEDLEALLA